MARALHPWRGIDPMPLACNVTQNIRIGLRNVAVIAGASNAAPSTALAVHSQSGAQAAHHAHTMQRHSNTQQRYTTIICIFQACLQLRRASSEVLEVQTSLSCKHAQTVPNLVEHSFTMRRNTKHVLLRFMLLIADLVKGSGAVEQQQQKGGRSKLQQQQFANARNRRWASGERCNDI